MHRFWKSAQTILLGLAGIGLSGCLSAPDYPAEPSITFGSLALVRNKPTGQLEVDTLKFTVNFQDGDGDLGLNATDLDTPPFKDTVGGHNNRGYSYNYFIQPYLKDSVTGSFSLFTTPAPFGFVGEYDGRFQRLVAAGTKAAPIRGPLNYKLPLTLDGLTYSPGQTFRFEISILDRALHESNQITTSEVTLGR